MTLLLASVACDMAKKLAVSSRCCLDKCHFVGCCVAGIPVVPVPVLVEWDGGSAAVEHCHCMIQIVRALVISHGTIIVEFLAQLLGLVWVGCTKAVVALKVSVGFVIQLAGFFCVFTQWVACVVA